LVAGVVVSDLGSFSFFGGLSLFGFSSLAGAGVDASSVAGASPFFLY